MCWLSCLDADYEPVSSDFYIVILFMSFLSLVNWCEAIMLAGSVYQPAVLLHKVPINFKWVFHFCTVDDYHWSDLHIVLWTAISSSGPAATPGPLSYSLNSDHLQSGARYAEGYLPWHQYRHVWSHGWGQCRVRDCTRTWLSGSSSCWVDRPPVVGVSWHLPMHTRGQSYQPAALAPLVSVCEGPQAC